MTDEAYPEAAEVLRAAGWAPHNGWGVYTRGTLVMGHPAPGEFRLKDWAAIPPGHPQYSADTPDTAVEAALWLVAKDRKSGHDAGHETDSEIVPEEQASRAAELSRPLADDAEPFADAAGIGAGEEDQPGGSGADVSDAAFDEIAAEGADLDPLLLPEPEPEDFAPDEIDLGAEILEDGPSFIFGPPADDTEALRSQRMGDVLRVSMYKQAEIWAASGTTEGAYQDLVSAVMRDTVQGLYVGSPEQFARFTELQVWANAASSVKNAEREKLLMLQTADRSALDAFQADEGWP